MIKITGHAPEFKRVITGWHSFDLAFADQKSIGFPLGQITETYGSPGTGKTTVTHSLAGVLARETKSNIVIADLEGNNQDLMVENLNLQGFDGEVHFVLEKRDEDTLTKLLDAMNKDYSVGILDAVGSISPVSEVQGDLGDSNMGRRAFLMAQFSRRGNHALLNNPTKSLFFLNHQAPRIGMVGTITPGGETKKYASSIRIQLSRMRRKNKEETYPDGSYIIQGVVKKNRWGFRDREFYLFVLAGKGVHTGLTAVYDSYMLGLTEREKTIKLNGVSFGYLKDLISEAQGGNDGFFVPFVESLKSAGSSAEEKLDVEAPGFDE